MKFTFWLGVEEGTEKEPPVYCGNRREGAVVLMQSWAGFPIEEMCVLSLEGGSPFHS